jgi:lysophospholipase L1-like esterase
VFFGANDASLPATNFRQHVPLGEFSQNLETIVETLRSQFPQAEILLITPPPIDEGVLSAGRLAGTRSNASAGEYAAAVVAAGSKLSAPVVDLWTSMQAAAPMTTTDTAAATSAPASETSSAAAAAAAAASTDGPTAQMGSSSSSVDSSVADWRLYLSDGLHLSAEGQRFVSSQVLACINSSSKQEELQVVPDPNNSGSFGNSGSTSSLLPDAPWHDKITDPLNFFGVLTAFPPHQCR